ncbi:ATP-binding protein, partial [Aeromonas caviae]|uniref:ATP-binding protein n=1 Tax=Aeromonas caviae TaxID=648 RepID=UPI002B49DC92
MEDFQINIDFNVLNHLGMGLYSNTPAVLTEIISNAWDADAELVSIELNKVAGTVSIIDNGNGMTESEIVNKFLKVGYARRDNGGAKSEVKRRQVMGRKGIGKLAMFSLANIIQVHTKKNSICNAFEIDVGVLKQCIKVGTPYTAKRIEPDFDGMNGTKIVLSDLTKSINRTESYLRKRLARRFSVIGAGDAFEVVLNSKSISMEDRDYLGSVQFLWEFGQSNPKIYGACKNKIKSDILNSLVSFDGKQYVWRWYSPDSCPQKGVVIR